MNKKSVSHKESSLKWYEDQINKMFSSQSVPYKLPYLYDYPLWPFVQYWVDVAKESKYADQPLFGAVVTNMLVEILDEVYDVVEESLLHDKREILYHKLCRECISANDIKSIWSDMACFLRWHCYSENMLDVLFYDERIYSSNDAEDIKRIFYEFMSKWTELLNNKVYAKVSKIVNEKEFEEPEEFNDDEDADFLGDDFDETDDYEQQKRKISKLNVLSDVEIFDNGFEKLLDAGLYKKHEGLITEIVNLLGRTASENTFKSKMEAMLQYTYPSPPFEDIDGVTSGNRIMDMLPTEFSYFAEPATEILFYQRFAIKQLQQFSSFPKEMKMSTQQSSANVKGPIIISIDTSGSMYGKPMEFAKWVVTKVYEIAKITKRPLYVINFSVNSRTLDLSSEDGQDKLMHFFKNCLSGGSDGHEMIKEILCQLDTETYRYADSLIVSDFQFSSLNEELEERVVKAQNNGAKFYGLCTDAGNKYSYPGGNYSYNELLDKIWQVRL